MALVVLLVGLFLLGWREVAGPAWARLLLSAAFGFAAVLAWPAVRRDLLARGPSAPRALLLQPFGGELVLVFADGRRALVQPCSGGLLSTDRLWLVLRSAEGRRHYLVLHRPAAQGADRAAFASLVRQLRSVARKQRDAG